MRRTVNFLGTKKRLYPLSCKGYRCIVPSRAQVRACTRVREHTRPRARVVVSKKLRSRRRLCRLTDAACPLRVFHGFQVRGKFPGLRRGGFFVKNTCIFLLAVVSYYGYKGWSSAVHTPECVDVPLREAA